MPYLIDGHNLIAALPDISLAELEDEKRLLQELQAYFTSARRSARVFFDAGRMESMPLTLGPFVRAVFIRPPRTADDAIRAELRKLGGEAPNWTVISSDGAVQRAARSAGARVLSSEAFAARLRPATTFDPEAKPEPGLSDEDIEGWLRLFQSEDD